MTLRYVPFIPLLCFVHKLTLTFVCSRERDTMDQRIGSIDDVIAAVTELVLGTIDWAEACQRLPAYDGVQAVD